MVYIDMMDTKMTKTKEYFYYIWYKFEFNVESIGCSEPI